MKSARSLAVTALIKILDEGGLSHIVMEDVLDQEPGLGERDRAFFVRLVKTVLEHLYSIDAAIDRHSSRPVDKLKPFVRETLRVAAAQILYFEKVPARAACDEAVRSVKHSKFGGLSGYVNAALRAMVRDAEGGGLEADIDEASVPEWIIALLTRDYGQEKARKMLDAFSRESGFTLRANLSRLPGSSRKAKLAYLEDLLVQDGANLTRSDENDECFRIVRSGSPAGLRAVNEGLALVQDESSWTAVKDACAALEDNARLSEETRLTVFDVCAAPGGKSMAAAELLGPQADIYAFDVSEEKCARIRENAARYAYDSIHARVRDASVPQDLREDADLPGQCGLLICDLPCSGLGIMGRKKDIRYRLKEEDIASLAQLQRRILDASLPLLAPGGILLYSTCTLDSEENSDQARYILGKGGFTLLKERQFLPGIDPCDGFYYALFLKNEP